MLKPKSFLCGICIKRWVNGAIRGLRRKESERQKGKKREAVRSWRNEGRCDPREVTNDRQHSRLTVITEYDTSLSTSIKWDFHRPNNYNLAAFVCVCVCESVSHYSHFPSFPVPILVLALITATCGSRGRARRDQSSEVRGMLLVFKN